MRPDTYLRWWFFGIVPMISLLTGSAAFGDGLSEPEILSVLPKGSVIASIPTEFSEDGREAAHRKAVIPVQFVPGVDSQAVVGYYTKPGRKEGQPIFHSRCHVALVGKKDTELQIIWDSGGWGFHFGMERIDERWHSDDQLALFFQVKDLNRDGKSELVFSRASFGAEGSRFEIWTYDAGEGKMVRMCDTGGWIKLIEGTGKGWPRIECRSFHASTMSTAVFEYDSNLGRYRCVSE